MKSSNIDRETHFIYNLPTNTSPKFITHKQNLKIQTPQRHRGWNKMSVIRSLYKMVTLTPRNVSALNRKQPIAQSSTYHFQAKNSIIHHRWCYKLRNDQAYLRFRDSTMPRSCHWGDADAGRGDISSSGSEWGAGLPGTAAEKWGHLRGSTRGGEGSRGRGGPPLVERRI